MIIMDLLNKLGDKFIMIIINISFLNQKVIEIKSLFICTSIRNADFHDFAQIGNRTKHNLRSCGSPYFPPQTRQKTS